MKHAVHDRILRCALLTGALLAAQTAVSASQGLPDFTDLVASQSKAVVNIATTHHTDNRRRQRPGMDLDQLPEIFRHFFREWPDDRQQRERHSLGSGFILSQDGYILTNNHVIEDADEIFVRLVDRREFPAALVGSDPRSDLALLKVDADGLPTVRVGRSAGLEVGEWVLAIGSPFGFEYSVTAGIVSAKGRSLPDRNNENYVPFIQTDVAINPGNSGGPLFDLDGRVVGINSQIYTRSGGFMGVSFAIPIDIAMDVVEQIKEKGSVSRGWLGVIIQDIDRDLADSFGLDKPSGALVVSVAADSPAEAGGVQPGDIIIKFDDTEIGRSGDLPHVVGRTRSGATVEAVIVRNGKRERLAITVGELDGEGGRFAGLDTSRSRHNLLGLAVRELPAAMRERLDLEAGVQVERVAEGSLAAAAGLGAGDIIMRLNNVVIDSVNKFNEVVAELPRGRSVPALVVSRGGRGARFVPLQVPSGE